MVLHFSDLDFPSDTDDSSTIKCMLISTEDNDLKIPSQRADK